ncbi:OmpA family protein [Pseudogemmobacter humi]|uniref:Putative lipoprotein YiaD n=1 Tax=Pseudogemmobacter humi TaxID=2483812 RepID=A0A3P5X367_9RHOB|nr:OmpA family protein [Pseudogemmobacter humi]VDC28651.1 putative lipoprotein YiaD precursor [Pseudogemmobacter humi]
MTRISLLLASAGAIALSGCVDPNAYPDNPNARQQQGAVLGGLVGAAAGASSGGDNRLAKAAVGGVIGAIAGGAIGATLDQQAAELRAQMSPGVGVTNHGDYLVVNMPQDLLFATDSATLSGSLTRDLNAVAQSLLKYPNSTIQVVGHTDSTGDAAYNMDLSQRRASAVASVLRNNGVPSGRISAVGRGEDQPVATNLTPEGRAKNRRVEIFIRPNA